jgi:sugar transferase (PEP-CTERM/EpsH1 system associated)
MKNKILITSSRLPYPPYRGDKLKIFNLIKQLSKMGHDITLISFIASKDEEQHLQKLKEYCSEVKTIYLPVWKSVLNCLFNIFSDKPFQVAYYASKIFKHQIEKGIASERFDIIHVHLIRMAQYMKNHSGGIPRVLDLTDAGSLYLERFLKVKKQMFFKILLKVELKRLQKYEGILETFEKVLVCSDVDKKHLLQHSPKAKIDLLYNGIDLEYFTNTKKIKPEPYRIIFTGNMSYFPNTDGILYFVKDIFPLIKNKIRGVQLYIVGKDPPVKIKKLANDNIMVTGFVSDIKRYYEQSSVTIAPIRFGAGTLNKILEPMALGIPVVTTSLGVEGLPVQTQRDLIIANNEADFADAVIQLLNDVELQSRISGNAKLLVRSLYGWGKIAEQLQSYYMELIS